MNNQETKNRIKLNDKYLKLQSETATKDFRAELRLSQPQFCLAFAIPLSTLRHWEAGSPRLKGAALGYIKALMMLHEKGLLEEFKERLK